MSSPSQLPSDWKKQLIGHLFEVQLGKMLNEKAKKGEQYPYLANFNVRWGQFDLSRMNTMFFSELEQKKYSLQHGDLFMCEGGEIGRCAVWKENDSTIFYQKALHRVRSKTGKSSTEYLCFYMQYIASIGRLIKLVGETSIAHLTREKLLALPILLPPLPEQKAIANLLSTWDEGIEKTERLIQAKEKRFKCLLRELIQEPRNDTKWKKMKLGEVCKVITSNVDKKTSPDEIPVRLCNYMDVYKNYYITSSLNFMEASATINEIEKYQLKLHDVLLTKDSETADDIANSACVLDASDHLLCGYHLAILRPKKQLHGPYLNFALHTPRIRYEFSRQANGATRFGLTMSAYNMVELPFPPMEEQQQIADTLSTAQQEIKLLKQIAEKYKAQKRGLMQKVLTGEWRIKPEVVKRYA